MRRSEERIDRGPGARPARPSRRPAPPPVELEKSQVNQPPADVDERIDRAIAESFPASDPPPWTLGPPSWSK